MNIKLTKSMIAWILYSIGAILISLSVGLAIGFVGFMTAAGFMFLIGALIYSVEG